MAEIVLSAKLASVTLKKLARSKGIQSELKKWEHSLSQIQDLLDDASDKEITNKAVKRWLNSLQHLDYDIDDILDELETEAMHHELTDGSGTITNKVSPFSQHRCNEIRYFWVSEAHAYKVLVNLRELVLWSCNDLVSLGEKEEDNYGNNFLTSLKMLEIWFCHNMTRCISPKNIQKLKIDSCSSITSVSLPTQKLKSVLIYDCKKLLEEELVGEKSNLLIKNKNMPMLENGFLGNLPRVFKYSRVVTLKIFQEVLVTSWWSWIRKEVQVESFHDPLKSSPWWSQDFPMVVSRDSSKELLIEDCPSMESIPDREFPSLTLLKHMTILNCPNMDSSFPRGLWPLNLHSLVIGKLKKPISQWGQQNFPASLVHLSLFGGSKEDDVSSCTQLSHLRPSSLTSLHVQNFEKLESLLAGLQHLTSLRHLSIDNVPNMKDMQEILFPSLSSLIIRRCPNLKERCSRRGCYWPLISHIPNVKIDGHYIH
ncbi:NB-ARC domains-containing protein [Artemisia annua]|uniref:NB-ARC domains-containing protein n=1 Tax=Artemisia annua TaxID=35608 RepID=A0A2U1PNP2_ARTAN|nr:NB-ARC domains-containing protein [Artemisia annua]